MSKVSQYPTKAAIARAVEAARRAGITPASITIEPNGAISVSDSPTSAQDEFAKWQSKHRR